MPSVGRVWKRAISLRSMSVHCHVGIEIAQQTWVRAFEQLAAGLQRPHLGAETAAWRPFDAEEADEIVLVG